MLKDAPATVAATSEGVVTPVNVQCGAVAIFGQTEATATERAGGSKVLSKPAGGRDNIGQRLKYLLFVPYYYNVDISASSISYIVIVTQPSHQQL